MLAPAKDASNVNTFCILSSFPKATLAVDSFDLFMENLESNGISYFE
jgi:hypothetical protein